MSGGEGKPWNGPLDTGNNGAKAMIQSGYKNNSLVYANIHAAAISYKRVPLLILITGFVVLGIINISACGSSWSAVIISNHWLMLKSSTKPLNLGTKLDNFRDNGVMLRENPME